MIQPATSVQPLVPAPGSGEHHVNGPAFQDVLRAAVTRVEAAGAEADRAVENFLGGGSQDLHSVALTAQKASLQFEMLLQVRNKVVGAYQEVMRMQL
jgi:flagellar hook-basal body complex protein FliE